MFAVHAYNQQKQRLFIPSKYTRAGLLAEVKVPLKSTNIHQHCPACISDIGHMHSTIHTTRQILHTQQYYISVLCTLNLPK